MENKRKKGFTLIELLAIIVILAIIAVITVPIILNIVDDSKKGAAQNSAYGYKDAINKYYMAKSLNNSDYDIADGQYSIDPQTGYLVGTETLQIQISGQAPTGGTVQITQNEIASACLEFGEYAVTILNGNVGQATKGTCNGTSIANSSESNDITITNKNAGAVVYFDPISSDTCNADVFETAVENNMQFADDEYSGVTCYKWNIISTDETNKTATIMLDHNLVNETAWNLGTTSENSDSSEATTLPNGPTTVLRNLANATNGWSRVSGINYTYDTTEAESGPDSYAGDSYGIFTCTNGTCKNGDNETIATNVKARLITGEEIKALAISAGATTEGVYAANTDQSIVSWNLLSVEDSYFISEDYTGIETNLEWLIQNTTEDPEIGATNNIYGNNNEGYWTLSPRNQSYAWSVVYYGSISYSLKNFSTYETEFYNGTSLGARPVITISQSLLTQ